jgi:hypothetical protein
MGSIGKGYLPRMKLQGMTNDECRLTNGGITSGFASGYDPTGLSVFLN